MENKTQTGENATESIGVTEMQVGKKYEISSEYNFDDDISEEWEYYESMNPKEENESDDEYYDRISEIAKEENETKINDVNNDDHFPQQNVEKEWMETTSYKKGHQTFEVSRVVRIEDVEHLEAIQRWCEDGKSNIKEVQ